jgi:hypothetical protein
MGNKRESGNMYRKKDKTAFFRRKQSYKNKLAEILYIGRISASFVSL